MTFGTVFHELALKLRQPLIISYIITGIAVLLFVVGLKLDVGLIRSVGPVALATGLGQIVFTSLFGFLLSLGLGFAPVKAIYIAACLTFSSTIIIVKLLTSFTTAGPLGSKPGTAAAVCAGWQPADRGGDQRA